MTDFAGNMKSLTPSFVNALDADRRAELQGHVGRAQNVAGHIAECAASEIVKTAPVAGQIEFSAERRFVIVAAAGVGPLFGDAEPEIPIESRGNRLRRRNHGDALRPDGAIGPGVDFGDVADLAGPNHFGRLARAFVRIALVAHLGGDSVFVRGILELARFPDGARERLLHVDVLAALHGPHGGGGVHEIRDGDDHGVDDRALLVQHLAEVFVLRNFFVLLELAGGARVVHVAECDDVLVRATADVAGGLASGADGGDIQLFVRGFIAEGSEGRNAAESGGWNGAG